MLLIGLSGLGSEVAKNLVLAGVGKLDMHDATPASFTDLSSNFLLSEADVGQPRSARAEECLAPLNPYVRVRALSPGPLDVKADALRPYACVVAVDQPHETLLALSDACRAAGCRLVCCDARGLFGRVVCDFGDEFVVDDPDGEPPKQALLEHVSSAAVAEVTCVQEQPHGLEEGDVVRLEEVGGMDELCAPGRTFSVRVLSRHALAIGDTRGAGAYAGGGRLIQIKQPKTLRFEPLREAAQRPSIVDTGIDAPARLRTLHACFCAADQVLPPTAFADDEAATAAADALAAAVEASGLVSAKQMRREVIDDYARTHLGRLSPMAAFVGGVAAQEVIKATTHRHTPLQHFLYVDGSGALPTPRPSVAECAPRADRYDGTRLALGEPLLKAMGRLQYFVVGAGAIGCELLKCLALLGVGCAEGGAIHLTCVTRRLYWGKGGREGREAGGRRL